jgi:hypothetical protein
MSKRATRTVAAIVAGLILLAGFGYTATRGTTYESNASLLLSPKDGTNENVVSALLDSFQRSGTAGTYVELISSKDTLDKAKAGATTITVRAVPDARTITVTAEGEQNQVQQVLTRVIQATQAREAELGDVWQIHVLGSPSPAVPGGISSKALLAATVLLAILGALFVIVVMRRYRFVPSDAGGQAGALGAGAGTPGGGGGGAVALGPVGGGGGGERTSTAELEQPAEVRVHFDLESFRYVRASPTTVLLQVTGYWRSDYPRELAEPTLLLHDGNRPHPIAPLAHPAAGSPESGPETPLWRGSYAAPIEIFERHERIALRAGPGVVVGLPHPIEQGLLAGGGRAAAAAAAAPVPGTNGHAPEHVPFEEESEPAEEPFAEAEADVPDQAEPETEAEVEAEPTAEHDGEPAPEKP